MVDLINTSFAGGEASPSFWGRTDEARFHVSASVLRNVFIDFRGGVKSRGGTRFCGPTWFGLSLPPRAITFRFSISEDFILVFGDKRMRVAFQGAYVTLPQVAITNITQGFPPTVTTATPHGQTSGNMVYLSGIVGMPELNNKFYTITGVTTYTFLLVDIFGATVNASGFSPYVSGGTVAPIYEIASPYAIADLPYLKFTQSADVMSICCVNTAAQAEYPPYDLERFSDTDWVFVKTTFQVSITPPTNLTSAASSTTPPSTTPPTLLTNYAYVVTAVGGSTGEESQASNVTYVQSVDIAVTAGSITLNWSPTVGAAYYNVYKAPAAYGANVPVGSQFGYAGSSFGTQFIDTNITQDFTTTPPVHVAPFARGQILQVNPTAPGIGYAQASTGFTVTTSTGSGLVGFPIIVNGAFVAFYIQNPGQDYVPGDTITIDTLSTAATGSYTFSGNPTNTQTIVLNGVTWTFVASDATGNQTNIQASVQLTVAQLAADLNASVNESIDVATYSAAYSVLSITYATVGTAGNAYTLAAGTYGGVVSGPTLTGGSTAGGGGSGATAALVIGPQTGTYPSVVAYFQQRRVYANSLNNPDTYWMSQTGAYTNMDASSPPIASDAITGSPWAQQVNGIQWLQPMPGGLIVGTGLDAWQLSGTSGAGSPVSPAQQDAQPQESNGFNPLLPPIKVNYDILYFQSLGTIPRDLEYNFFANIYAGQDIGLYSNHLFENYQVTQWAWAKEPYKVMWCVRNDGKLLALTYVKEQKVFGWTRSDTNGAFVSVTSASEPPVDATYFITQRYVVGKQTSMYYLERMDDRLWQGVDDVWAVDCGLSLTQPAPDATLSASSATGVGTLVYPTVVFGGGGYTDPSVVVFDPSNPSVSVNGAVTLSGGAIASFTASGVGFANASVKITDATGAGAVLSVQVQNLALFTASKPVFDGVTTGVVGQVIRMDGGRAVVLSRPNNVQVYAAIVAPLALTVPNDPLNTPVVAQSGAWTITTPITTLSGLDYWEGGTVSALADGNAYLGLVVKDGSVTLPAPASDIKVGPQFIAQTQALHTDIGGAQTVQGKPKNVTGVTVRMEKTRGLQIGANQPIASALEYQQEVEWGQAVKLQPLQDRTTSLTYGQPIPLFTGDKYLPINDVWRVQLNQQSYGMVAAQQIYPLPMGISAFIYKIDFAP